MFECEVAGMNTGCYAKVVTSNPSINDDVFATVYVEDDSQRGGWLNMNEVQLRTLAIALNMAADELKERSDAAR